MNKEPIIFIDTEDMEERYAESLYMDYLKEENEQLKDRINKAIEYCNKTKEPYEEHYGESFEEYDWVVDIARDLLEILKGGNNE